MKLNKEEMKTINIHIGHINKLFSEFSCGDNLILNAEFVSHFAETYLQTKIKSGDYKINITVNHEPTSEEIARARYAFKNHFENEVLEDTMKISKYNKHAAILLILSVTIFTVLYFLYQLDGQYLGVSILEVLSWVITWKFIDSLTFFKIEARINRKRNIWARDAEVNIIQKIDCPRNRECAFC